MLNSYCLMVQFQISSFTRYNQQEWRFGVQPTPAGFREIRQPARVGQKTARSDKYVNPQTVKGNECIVSESAATFRRGGFVSITSDSVSERHNLPYEAGDLRHRQPHSLASTPLI